MNCEQVKELLSAYLDNALAPEERRSVATHLEACPECSEMLADFRRFDVLLSRMPRINPDASLRERIFSSQEYLELTGTSGVDERLTGQTVPHKQMRYTATQRPQLVALPGGRSDQRSSSLSSLPGDLYTAKTDVRKRGRRGGWGQRIMQIVIAATVLLTLGVGSFIGWNVWKQQPTVAHNTNGITPPAGPGQGPIPAGIRFLFLRNGALWSAPTDGGNGVLRLTPENTTVAANWTVRPALAGRSAGNLIAYIDLQQGFVHIIRSDGQNDIAIQQALLKPGVSPSSQWDTDTGTAILNSLAWSKDGSMLAFIADPKGAGQPGLYIYTLSTGAIRQVTLPIAGTVSRSIWSPDSVRIAFAVKLNGKTGILDYNAENNGVLTLSTDVNAQGHPGDTLLSLDWSPTTDTPAVTWTVGSVGHVRSIWTQRVGIEGNTRPVLLASGDYAQANYSRNGHNGAGSWLLVINNAGVAGDILMLDLSASVEKLTIGKRVSVAQWSPDGTSIDYFEALSSGLGTFHVVNTLTGIDTLVAASAAADPAPTWSADSLHLAYSTGVHVLVVDLRNLRTSQPLKQQSEATAFSWSADSPSQLVLVSGDGPQGIYLVDTQHDTSLQLDREGIQGPIQWAQIP